MVFSIKSIKDTIFMRIIPIFATNTEISKEKIEEGIEKRPIEVNGIDLLIHQDNNLYKLSKLNFNYYLNKNNNKFEEESTSSKGKEIIQENKEFFELNMWIEFTKPGKYLIRLTQDMYEYPSFVLQFFIKVEKREILPNEKSLQIYVGETDFKDESEIKLFKKPSSYDEFAKNLINIANIIPFLNDNFFYEIKNNKDNKKGEGNKKGKEEEGFNYSKAMGAFGIGH
ncbi:hypothetical protein Mgra_00003087 [Meloidogyne graminicola]|uniref:Uncharacterized protein n=1 Tax=Meloidogyne graminicola TaxID=189291 RepID=A0A8S9ZVB1_9BILA|nr:hypothetical protein Mgra_00003087 [Meloidogyne graminicola]